MVSAVVTESVPALLRVAVSDRLPWSAKIAPRATVTGVLVEVPVRVSVPPVTPSEPPPSAPETRVLPVLVVGPLSVPETVAPSSAAVPLKLPARMALVNVPPPRPFRVSGAASVPPVKIVAPVTVRVPVPLTVPALLVRLPTVSKALTVSVPALVSTVAVARPPLASVRVAPPAIPTMVLASEPVRVRVPALMAVGPVNRLALVSSRLAAPVLSKPLVPASTELTVSVPVCTLMEGAVGVASLTRVMTPASRV